MSSIGVNVGNVSLKSPLILASGTCNFGHELSEYYDLSILGGLSDFRIPVSITSSRMTWIT